MYQTIVIEGRSYEVIGNHPTLAEANVALAACLAATKQFHFAILKPDGSVWCLAGSRR